MMWLQLLLLGSILVAWTVPARADLTAARNEKNPEKSYWLALENADKILTQARENLVEGKLDLLASNLHEIVESVEFARDKLYSTGKSPSRNSKHFKRAELKIRDFLRKLQGLEQTASFEERPPIEAAKKKLQQIHDDLLLDIMGSRKP
ncbi:MAG: hypothetical protein NZV14_08895 [Bryobacteraceae bacterium]|nr:hypothetical protein [Bryobacteraceae bacterium]MDW8378266.1 hypothetical protein [Bryobacterales bacterium]